MRKVKLQMQVSLDGYVAGPNGELDWMVWNWDNDLKNYVNGISEPVDNILLGRKLAEGFIPYWASAVANPGNEDLAFAKKMNDTPKIVFSKTIRHVDSGWENTKLAKGNIVEEITELKKQPGKDIIAYGGANFVSNLIKQALIDDYYLFLNPVALGNGMSIFKGLENKLKLRLLNSKSFECGIVLFHYQPG